MALLDTIIKEYVNKYNSGEDAEEVYRKSIQAARRLNLKNVSKEDIEQVAQPFLYEWGRMGRVLGRAKFVNWRESLANVVSRNASLLQRYATIDLTDADLPFKRQHIAGLCESFRGAVSQVAATKCLHLFCPGFFPMWDTAIAGAARKERNASGLEEFSTEDFCQFVEQIRSFIVSNSVLISFLAEKYDKTKVKIVDEIFWWATQRPLCLIL